MSSNARVHPGTIRVSSALNDARIKADDTSPTIDSAADTFQRNLDEPLDTLKNQIL